MDFCSLPPDRVKLAVNSKKETNSRVKMGKESKLAKSQDRLLLFTFWKSQNGTKVIMSCCCLPPDRVKLIVNSRIKMGCCCLPPDWVKLTVNSKKETNSRVKTGQQSRWASVIYPLKESKLRCCCLLPDRVKLAVNSSKETNSRVKKGKESRLPLFTPWKSQTNSEQQERNKQQGQNGPRVQMGFCYLSPERVKMGQRSLWAAVVYPLTEWN